MLYPSSLTVVQASWRSIMRKALPTAREAIDRVGRIVLSERDTKRVLKLLSKRSKPTPALIAAAWRRTRIPLCGTAKPGGEK
jgi:uncharacterized protein (DUF1778 family)